MKYKPFSFKTLDELRAELSRLNVDIPFCEDVSALSRPIKVGKKTLPNRILYQPMEGCDGEANGAVSELSARKYLRQAAGGPAVIWLEAISVLEKSRANPFQLHICDATADSFARLIENIRTTCLKENGFDPLIIAQLTHSGRYSKPHGVPEPIIAYNNPIFEKDKPIGKNRIITDDELKSLEEAFTRAAVLFERAGADGVDIKSCHRYLYSELLSAYTREGAYGGSFENRTRALRNTAAAVKAAASSDFIVTSRLNVYDGFPYPYGFGVNPESDLTPDLTESKHLVKLLKEELGYLLIDITAGNPYVNPNVNRPADTTYNLELEPPLVGVARILSVCAEIKRDNPDLIVANSGSTYLRKFAANANSALILAGLADLAGMGRSSIANPGVAKEMTAGTWSDKNCICCGKCSELMRGGLTAGCVVRDTDIYLPLYKSLKK